VEKYPTGQHARKEGESRTSSEGRTVPTPGVKLSLDELVKKKASRSQSLTRRTTQRHLRMLGNFTHKF